MNTNKRVTKLYQSIKSSFRRRHVDTLDVKYSEVFNSDGFKRFRTYFGNVQAGNPKVYVTPFAKGVNTKDLLDEWQAILESKLGDMPELLAFELDLREKVGPMSVQKPIRDRIDDIAHYYQDVNLPSVPVPAEAIQCVRDEFRPINGLRLRTLAHTAELMKKSSNSGAPDFTKRRNVLLEYVNTFSRAFTRAMSFKAGIIFLKFKRKGAFVTEFSYNSGFKMNAAIIGWRGQEGGATADDVKQRVIWMFPAMVNMAELQVYQPLIEACQSTNLVPAWISNDAVDARITALFDSKAEDDLVVCTDFSRFDQHFNADMQYAAYSILSTVLTPEEKSNDWLEYIFPMKYDIPLIIGAGPASVEMTTGKHGMASGSGGTNADETLAHRALQHEAAISAGKDLNINSMCLGDDGILTYPGISVEHVVEVYKSHGQELNLAKQYASNQDCVFLRRFHSTHYRVNGICVGIYSTLRCIGRLRYLERWMDPEVWTPENVELKYISAIENCKWHPLFREFVIWCMKWDKYRLGVDIPGFLDNIQKHAEAAIDLMPEFLGYTKTLQGEGVKGIAGWETVKILKEFM